MPHEQEVPESDCWPQIALACFFCWLRCIGQSLALQQQHSGAEEKAEASMADGDVSRVTKSTIA